jgi:hydroxymethylpyrimidine pyrophosphatase-like HAD family hydrolase
MIEKEKRELSESYLGWSVIFDMDGVVGKMLLRPQGVDHFRPTQLQHLKAIGIQNDRFQESGVRTAINTGRGVEETIKIARELKIQESICENGAILADSQGSTTLLLPENMQETALYLGGELTAQLKEGGYWLSDKYTLCTAQIPTKLLQDKTGTEKFKDELLTMALTFNKFRGLYENGDIKCTISSEAIDFSLSGWGKGKGVKAYLERYGLDSQKALAIGDTTSDISMMEICGYAACPSDATDGLKDYLSKRDSVYVAKLPLAIGTMQILHAFGKVIESGDSYFPDSKNSYNPHLKIMDIYETELGI